MPLIAATPRLGVPRIAEMVRQAGGFNDRKGRYSVGSDGYIRISRAQIDYGLSVMLLDGVGRTSGRFYVEALGIATGTLNAGVQVGLVNQGNDGVGFILNGSTPQPCAQTLRVDQGSGTNYTNHQRFPFSTTSDHTKTGSWSNVYTSWIGVGIDYDVGSIKLWINGILTGELKSSIGTDGPFRVPKDWAMVPALLVGLNANTAQDYLINLGQVPFRYPPPPGFDRRFIPSAKKPLALFADGDGTGAGDLVAVVAEVPTASVVSVDFDAFTSLCIPPVVAVLPDVVGGPWEEAVTSPQASSCEAMTGSASVIYEAFTEPPEVVAEIPEAVMDLIQRVDPPSAVAQPVTGIAFRFFPFPVDVTAAACAAPSVSAWITVTAPTQVPAAGVSAPEVVAASVRLAVANPPAAPATPAEASAQGGAGSGVVVPAVVAAAATGSAAGGVVSDGQADGSLPEAVVAPVLGSVVQQRDGVAVVRLPVVVAAAARTGAGSSQAVTPPSVIAGAIAGQAEAVHAAWGDLIQAPTSAAQAGAVVAGAASGDQGAAVARPIITMATGVDTSRQGAASGSWPSAVAEAAFGSALQVVPVSLPEASAEVPQVGSVVVARAAIAWASAAAISAAAVSDAPQHGRRVAQVTSPRRTVRLVRYDRPLVVAPARRRSVVP
jgi:hypothetical protein